jgi:hypothetical protein
MSSGYEEDFPIFEKCKLNKLLDISEEEKENLFLGIFKIYRDKNYYPIFYFNEDGIQKEIIRCVERDVFINNNVITSKFNQGSGLLKFMFPNIHKSYYGNVGDVFINAFDKFYDDKMLIDIVRFQSQYDSPIPSRVLSASNLYRTRTPSNFSPMRAKAIFEKYCPVNGVVYDFSCGWGGRMLGALTSKNNYKYVGVEPNSETFNNLNILGKYVETVLKRKNSFSIYKECSEDFVLEKSSIDFAFSSPPYFNLEKYCDEGTQCYNKFPEIESWFNNYVVKTIENIHIGLKDNGYYAVNIADFNLSPIKKIYLVDRWIEISEKIGFDFVEMISMKLGNRGGKKRKGQTGGFNKKEEGVYVFKKVDEKLKRDYSDRKLPQYMEKELLFYSKHKRECLRIENEFLSWYSANSEKILNDKEILLELKNINNDDDDYLNAKRNLNKLLKN